MAKKKAKTWGGVRKGAGRKPAGGLTPLRSIRVSDAEWEAWQVAATSAGKTVSEWLREIANAACG